MTEGDESLVTIQLTQEGEDTRLHLIHSRLTNPDFQKGASAGWHAHLDLLVDLVNGTTARDFWVHYGKLKAKYDERILGGITPDEENVHAVQLYCEALMTDFLFNGKKTAKLTFALAHGAGAGMDTPFMDAFAEGIAAAGFHVARFEFPYMVQARESGKGRPPNRAPKLIESWMEVISQLGSKKKLVIGGKSMGGRIASLVADDAQVDGLVCLGYPFHPVGKPEKLRTEHLEKIKTPTLIVQGERDTFGKPDEVATYKLSKKIKIEWLADGDHSFKPRKSSGKSLEENWDEGIDKVVKFLNRLG